MNRTGILDCVVTASSLKREVLEEGVSRTEQGPGARMLNTVRMIILRRTGEQEHVAVRTSLTGETPAADTQEMDVRTQVSLKLLKATSAAVMRVIRQRNFDP